MTKVKNPPKKKTRKVQTSAEKLLSIVEAAPRKSDNYVLIVFEKETTQFRIQRQALGVWNLVVARRKLRRVSDGLDEREYLDRKEPKELASILRGAEIPYFYCDFPTEKSRYCNWSSNLELTPEHRDMAEVMLTAMIEVETRQWHFSAMQQGQHDQIKNPSGMVQ